MRPDDGERCRNGIPVWLSIALIDDASDRDGVAILNRYLRLYGSLRETKGSGSRR